MSIPKKEVVDIILERIKELCAEQGLTIHSLEEKAGLSNGVVDNWGKSSPNLGSIKAVADVLNVSIDELVHGWTPKK